MFRSGLIVALALALAPGCKSDEKTPDRVPTSGSAGKATTPPPNPMGKNGKFELKGPRSLSPGVVPATRGTVERTFSIRVSGTGTGRVKSVDITDNRGSLEIGKIGPGEIKTKREVFVYKRVRDRDGQQVFQGLAVGGGAWYVIWFFCKDGKLENMRLEGTDQTHLRADPGTGTCEVGPGPVTLEIEIPEHTLIWPRSDVEDSFTLKGKTIHIDRGVGTMKIEGRAYEAGIFTGANCLDGCGTTEPGWWELHSMLRDPTSGEACFSIGAFSPSQPRVVTFQDSLCLPTLAEPTVSHQAGWIVPEGRRPKK